MKIRKFLFIFLSPLLLSSTPTLAKPVIECPAVSAIQQVGVNHAEVNADKTWDAWYEPAQKYNTPDDWRFTIASTYLVGSKAENVAEAMQKATAALSKLSSPLRESREEFVMCSYLDIPDGVTAYAFSGLPSYKSISKIIRSVSNV